MNIEEIVDDLQQKYVCKLVGQIEPFGEMGKNGEVTSDIDFLTSPSELGRVAKYLDSKNFVLENKLTGVGVVGRCCTGARLYHLDIASMSLFLHWFSDVTITRAYREEVWQNRDLEKFLRYILQFRNRREKYKDFVREKFTEYGKFLSDSTYLTKPVFRKGVRVEDVIGVMEKRPISFIRAFSFTRIVRIIFTYCLFQVKKVLQRKGEIVAFVGADGSGKTTVLEKMSASIGTHSAYMGENYFVLQKLYEWFFSLPRPFSYAVYLFIYIEQCARYLKIFFKKVKGDKVYVDRWPGFSNFHKSRQGKLLGSILYRLFPKPDRFVFLSAAPETIHKRKPELTLKEIEITQTSIRERLKGKNFAEVSTDDYTNSINHVLQYLIYGEKNTIDIKSVLTDRLPTVIEFTGIYASGKTTTAHELVKELRARGYRVLDNDDMWRYLAGVSKFRRRWGYLTSLATWKFIFSVFTSKILYRKKDFVEIPKRKLAHHVVGPMRDITDRKLFIEAHPEADFIVFDEGALYVIMDLLWKFHLPENRILYYARKIDYTKDAYTFYFQANPGLSHDRTQERSSSSLIDKENDEVRQMAILELMPYHDAVVQYMKTELRSQSLSPEDCTRARVVLVVDQLGLLKKDYENSIH